jgi:hypothetical protein
MACVFIVLGAAGWTIGVLGFDSRRGLGIFLFTAASGTAVGPTQPSIQWVTGSLSLRAKWLGCEADYSPPSSSQVKECVELYIHSPYTPSWSGAQLKKHRDNFSFSFISCAFRIKWNAKCFLAQWSLSSGFGTTISPQSK